MKEVSLVNSRKIIVIHISFLIFLLFLIYIIFFFKKSVLISFFSSEEDINITVDLVYKYINLKDKNLKRGNVKQTEKDIDNEELKYSLRSVEENIPWINKIYIIMPNEHIPFINESKKEVNKKIIYIKDKDILGFDSSSSITFEHNALRNLRRYNVSECFLYMNDDYFINRKLKKKDFFYYSEREGRYVPYVMKCRCKYSNNNYKYHKNYYRENYKLLNSRCKQTTEDYRFQNCAAYILLYKIFKNKHIKTMSEVKVTFHNILPLSLIDLQELYEVEKNEYKFQKELMEAKERNNKQITFEIVYSFYFLNKYNRKLGRVTYMYYSSERSEYIIKGKEDSFVINKGSKKLRKEVFGKQKIAMGQRFNRRSKYEKNEIEDGLYSIRNVKERTKKKKALRIGNNIITKNTLFLSSNLKENESNVFYIQYNYAEGYYTIRTKDKIRKLRVCYRYRFLNYIIKTYEQKNDKLRDEEKWNIIPFSDSKNISTYFILNEKFNKCITRYSFLTYLSNIITVKKTIGDNNQLFVLEKVEKSS